ncbi:MAG TPA: protease pro-enzyme activation domain-containing protein [Rhodanobacteraceae bacterium]|nr:protease pro-enzyme activation domain-containing protein [Rhodanobacteraceae bacterium]
MPNHFRLKALVVAMGLAAGATAFAASPPAPAGTAVIKAATQLRATDTVVGPMALTQSMRVTLSLHWRNEAGLKAFIAEPHHPNLTQAEFNATYAPPAAQVDQVKAFLQQHGFTDIQVSADSLLVSGEAPVAKVQAAFSTTMVNVRTKSGRLAFANSAPAHVPAALQGVVDEVIGLDTVHVFHTAPISKIAPAANHVEINPPDFASIYNASSLPAATAAPAVTSSGISIRRTSSGCRVASRRSTCTTRPR